MEIPMSHLPEHVLEEALNVGVCVEQVVSQEQEIARLEALAVKLGINIDNLDEVDGEEEDSCDEDATNIFATLANEF